MISIKQIDPCECENCKRVIPLILEYIINDKKLKLCEDCSNSLVNLHYPCVKYGGSYMYHEDEIVKKEDSDNGKQDPRE